MKSFTIGIATKAHFQYAEPICQLIEASAKQRGTGIAKRDPKYITKKMAAGNAIIALQNQELAGFCYIEIWEHGKYVANSGLIVSPKFRRNGLAKKIKETAFNHARNTYPTAKVFGITTSLPVMKINSALGYQPVTFSELPQEDTFWESCSSCPNYPILQRNKRKLCLCTGMLAPSKEEAMKLDLTHKIINNTMLTSY